MRSGNMPGRNRKTAVVFVSCNTPEALLEVEVERNVEDLEWWAVGAVSMTVTFQKGGARPKFHAKRATLNQFVDVPADPACVPTGNGFVYCRIEGADLSKAAGSGEYAKYVVSVQYPNGGTFKIDPFVIIQP